MLSTNKTIQVALGHHKLAKQRDWPVVWHSIVVVDQLRNQSADISNATFIRLIREHERKEILLCTDKKQDRRSVRNSLKKNGDTMLHGVTLDEGATNPEAIRVYEVYCGSETYLLHGVHNDPVVRVIQDIYDRRFRSPNWKNMLHVTLESDFSERKRIPQN